ncbi:MAG: hypothetical protein MI974_08830 [Chitinophagales bacterium]|nr:hypothetical protein [Chitinophagales bacterium]
MKHIIMCLLLLALFDTTTLKGQDCKAILEDYRQKMASIQAPDTEDRVHYLKYSVELEYNDNWSGEKLDDQEIEFLLGNDFYLFQNQIVTKIGDEENAYTIVHPEGLILWNPSDLELAQQVLRKQQFETAQAVLLQEGTIEQCESTPAGINIISVQLPEDMTRQSHIESVSYRYDINKEKMKEVKFHYEANYPLVTSILLFEKMQFNLYHNNLKSAYESVFNSNGSLLAKYNGYQVIDNR